MYIAIYTASFTRVSEKLLFYQISRQPNPILFAFQAQTLYTVYERHCQICLIKTIFHCKKKSQNFSFFTCKSKLDSIFPNILVNSISNNCMNYLVIIDLPIKFLFIHKSGNLHPVTYLPFYH